MWQEAVHAPKSGGSHAHPHGRPSIRVQGLWEEICGAQWLAATHENTHRRETAQVSGVRKGLYKSSPSEEPLNHALWQKGILVLRVWKRVWIQVEFGSPPEDPFRRETLSLQHVR